MFLSVDGTLLTAGTQNTFVEWYQTVSWEPRHVFGGYNAWQSYYINPHSSKIWELQ